MNLTLNLMCFVSNCVFFYKLNAYCVFYPVVMGELTSARLSLLSYHCSDDLVTMIQLFVVTVTYGSLLQWLVVVV
jgi:hypothetical protein